MTVGGSGHIPSEFFDFLISFIEKNNGKAKFRDMEIAIRENAIGLIDNVITATQFVLKPELVIFSAFAQGLIHTELKDRHNLNLVKARSIFTLVKKEGKVA